MAAANVDKQNDEFDRKEKGIDLVDNEIGMREAIAKDSKDVPPEPLQTPWTFWIDRSIYRCRYLDLDLDLKCLR